MLLRSFVLRLVSVFSDAGFFLAVVQQQHLAAAIAKPPLLLRCRCAIVAKMAPGGFGGNADAAARRLKQQVPLVFALAFRQSG